MRHQHFYSNDFQSAEAEESFALKKWITRMVYMWPWFAGSLVLCLAAAYLYLSIVNPVYKASASVLVKDKTKGVEISDNPRVEDVGLKSSSKLVVNEIEILKSYDLIENVVDSLQLFVNVSREEPFRNVPVFGSDIPFVLSIINPENISKPLHWSIEPDYAKNALIFRNGNNGQPISIIYDKAYSVDGVKFICRQPADGMAVKTIAPEKDDTYKITVVSPDEATLMYTRKISIEPANKLATVINLELEDYNKKRVFAVLNTLLGVYGQQTIAGKNRTTAGTIKFLDDRLLAVATDLKAMEGNVERFKSKNKVTNLSDDAEKFLTTSQQVDLQKAQIQTQLNIINALEQDLQRNQNNPQLVPSTAGLQDQSLNSLIEKHNDLVLQRESLEQKSGPKNPLLVDLQNQIADIRGRLISSVQSLKQAYNISLGDITKKDELTSSQIRNVPQLEKDLVQMTRSKDVLEQLYSFLLQKREEAAVSRVSSVEDFQTIAKARDLGIVSPKAALIWGMAVLAGLLLPLLYLNFRSFLGNRVGDVAQVEENTDVPLLGVITHVKKLNSSVIINANSRSAVAEQIRNIRTAINFSTKEKSIKTILVTSFQPGDGKSFVSLNLAAGFALLKKKTVMLEFDLRKPHISKDLGLNSEEGICSILEGNSGLNNLFFEVQGFDGYLSLLPAGKVTSNPAELISGANVSRLFKVLQERFDYIVINTAPLGLVTDATLLQQYADMTLIILRQGHTSREVYSDLNHRIAKDPQVPVFLLLNDVGKKKVYRTPYGNGSYAYGFGKGYYHKEKV